ncbi:MAG: hypothetical protein AAGJ18_08670 [Bacteroidota bacterium]
MKYLTTFLFVSLFAVHLLSQVQGDRREEPYPAPVSYEKISDKKATFMALFEDRNVGNLHLYAAPKLKKKRTYQGEVIPASYKYYFPADIWDSFRKKKLRPRALYSIRGDAEDWYIMRISDNRAKNSLRLYEWQGDNLVEKKMLAYTKCRGKNCEQLDSWIRDIDGDTNLDIVQKKASLRRGKVNESTVQTFSIDDRGVFRKTDELAIDAGDYQLEKMKASR